MLEDVENMWTKDCMIDPLDLQQSSVDTYRLHSKYYKMLNACKAKLHELEIDRSRMQLLRTEYYMGILDQQTIKQHGWKPNAKVIMKTDIPNYLACDENLVEINLKVANIKTVMEFIDSILRMIINRGFHIRNMIEDRKFINGGN